MVANHARASFLNRHFDVTGKLGMTRVWFPYGDTGQARSIDLGQSRFDERIMLLERDRAALMEKNNQYDYGHGPGLSSPVETFERHWHSFATWCDFLCAPLVIVGASLPTDDWPMWWLLHQRARYFVPFNDWEVAETFYLTSRPCDAGHVANGAAGVEMVAFRSDEELWRFVLSALEAAGVEKRARVVPRTTGVSKSQAIRRCLRAHPKATVREVVAILAEKKIMVPVPLVYLVKASVISKRKKRIVEVPSRSRPSADPA